MKQFKSTTLSLFIVVTAPITLSMISQKVFSAETNIVTISKSLTNKDTLSNSTSLHKRKLIDKKLQTELSNSNNNPHRTSEEKIKKEAEGLRKMKNNLKFKQLKMHNPTY